MRRIAYGEGWLRANMVIMVLDGIPLNLEELMGRGVCGDSFTKNGKDFITIFPLKLVLVPPFSFGMTAGVRRVLFKISSPLFIVLAMNKDATIANYCQSGSGAVVWSPIFIQDALVNETILTSFLNKLNGVAPQDSTDAVSCDLNSKRIFTFKSYSLKLLSCFFFAIQAGSFGSFLGKLFGRI